MEKRTLGAALSHGLKARGVDVIFGIPGVHNVELYRGIEEAGITHVLARHEQGAGFMADGYARASGKPGVAFIITGPGLTNIMTPMGQAYSDSVPMLVISSCLPEGDMPGRLHQMRDQLGAAACVGDWSELATDGETAFALVDRALAEFQTDRPRPKHITVPLDVLGAPVDGIGQGERSGSDSPLDHGQIKDVAKRLDAAHRPLFVFGGGATYASQMARRVVEKSGAAVFCSYAGRGVVAGSYPLNFGSVLAREESAKIFAGADLVVVVGSELAEVDLWRHHLGHECDMVRVDIDQGVLQDCHGASTQINADAEAFLTALEGALTDSPAKWDADEVARLRQVSRAQTDADFPGIVPLCLAMQAALPAETMYYSDMTQFAYAAKEVCPMEHPGHWHHPFGFGTLGYGLPAAIGGKIARPGLPTVAIAGDYGFQYTLQELGVAAELNLSLPIILWDNGKLKEIEDCMIRSQIAPNAVVAQNPDFQLLAQAYGVNYAAPQSIGGFQDALRTSLDADGPTIIHITPATNS